jgi:arsenate reductase
VLFVDMRNTGRSQLAAGLLEASAEGGVHSRSAGLEPEEALDPNVLAAMGELGIDMSRRFPKPLTYEVVKAADVVVTFDCGDQLTHYDHPRYVEWGIADPVGVELETVRAIRDQIHELVKGLVDELDLVPREVGAQPAQPTP